MTDSSAGERSAPMQDADVANGEGSPGDHRTGDRQAAENRENDPPA